MVFVFEKNKMDPNLRSAIPSTHPISLPFPLQTALFSRTFQSDVLLNGEKLWTILHSHMPSVVLFEQPFQSTSIDQILDNLVFPVIFV